MTAPRYGIVPEAERAPRTGGPIPMSGAESRANPGLCVPCHRAKTKAEAAERARIRRAEREAGAPQLRLA